MLRQLVNEYIIELKMNGSSKHTVYNYGLHLDKFIEFAEANSLDISSVTARQVKEFRNLK